MPHTLETAMSIRLSNVLLTLVFPRTETSTPPPLHTHIEEERQRSRGAT